MRALVGQHPIPAASRRPILPADRRRVARLAVTMISAVVLVPDGRFGDNHDHAREIVVRSLVWLVSAVVEGAVRDVTLAAPAVLDLAGLADQSGCTLVEAPTEEARLTAAVGASRQTRLILLLAGYQPDPGFTDEIATIARRTPPKTLAVLRAAPATAWERLLPRRAPVVGILCPRTAASPRARFADLARRARRGRRLQTLARPIV